MGNYIDKDNKKTLTNALGDTVVLYDDNDRATEVTTPNFDKISYSYNVDDTIAKVTAPGVETSLTYNGGTKVATMKGINKPTGTVVTDLGYSYNEAEQIIQITDKGAVKKKYTYTPSGYLETVQASNKTLKYSYDGNGNVLKVENLTTGKGKETYSYAAGNRISQKKEYDETTGSLLRTTDYLFHPNGSVSRATTKEGTNTTVIDYGYNSDDQLVSIRKNVNGQEVQNITYGYDHDGIRLTKTVNGERYFFHRDTNGEIFTITKEDTTSQDVMNFYRDGEGNLLSFRYNEVLYYYQFNARGDVTALTDSAGNVKVTYDYDEWGNVIGTTGDQTLAEANPYRYVGKFGVLYDADANTYLMGWRDFDPTTGRFIVPDTYEGEDDEPTTLNRYLYAEGDPVNNIDPDGNFGKWLQAAWKIGRGGFNVLIGDDIRTLTSPKTKWYQKAGAGISIALNFVPGAGQVKWAAKGIKVGVKAAVKTIKYARSLRITKKAKVAVKSGWNSFKNSRTYKAINNERGSI